MNRIYNSNEKVEYWSNKTLKMDSKFVYKKELEPSQRTENIPGGRK